MKYPKFIYQKYFYKVSGKDLKIFFYFKIEHSSKAQSRKENEVLFDHDISFRPEITIKNIPGRSLGQLDNLVFHLGLIEMISYWKATCSPTIEVLAGCLDKNQIKWWQGLIMKGMGQFSFENKIPFQKPKIICLGRSLSQPRQSLGKLGQRILVPVGGGKDSVVTLELLKKAKKNINCFSLNPTDSAKKIMDAAGCKNPVIIERKIDKRLLELNKKGFLNGHTPFSAYLAFLSILLAVIFGYRYIALSNERSSNEGNVKYRGKTINHQWSKSFEFEQKFRGYSKKYLAKETNYFSFLRPLYEIQIAKLFSKYPKYFPLFLSCNEAYKTASGTKKPTKKWCSNCSKCLFAFAVLYPFLEEKETAKIFKKNLFEDKNLLPIMQQLIGERGFKPFECVGTKKESLMAFYLSWKKAGKVSPRPYLLDYFEKKILPKYKNLEKESKEILNSWNKQNNLPKGLNL